MKHVCLLVFLISTLSSCAENEAASEKLEKYKITADLLTRNLRDADAEHFFQLKSTLINGEEVKTVESTFDPTRDIGERWNLVSVNGSGPTAADHKEFDRAHNTKRKAINGRVNHKSWGIEKDDEDSLIIRFKYDKKSLPKKYSFLGDCQGLAYFNRTTERLEKAEFVNEKPIKIKFLNVGKLDMVVHYEFHEEEGHYLIKSEELDMEVNLLGQLLPVKEHNEYINYRKVD